MATTASTPSVPTAGRCGCAENDRLARSPGRRGVLKAALAAGVLGAVAGPMTSTQLSFAGSGYTGDVLVVLSLRGGFDGLSAVVPAGDPAYYSVRPDIGIPASRLLPLDARFGLHPAMAPLMPMWKAGTLGVVHAVGQANPTRSHFAAMDEMERAAPGTSVRTGWIDRTLGLTSGAAHRGMQVGSPMPARAFAGAQPELPVQSVDRFVLQNAKDNPSLAGRWAEGLRLMHSQAPPALAAPAATTLAALATMGKVAATAYRPAGGAAYPAGELGDAMKEVARLVKARIGLQVAAVDYGDWDMHAGMGGVDQGWLFDKLTALSQALAAFATDLGPELGNVTLVTLSEFGRRAYQNGSAGTDHGHGNAVLLLGGGVQGGRVHGAWPGLGSAELVDGDLAGTTDYRSIIAEILTKRCGAGSLSTVFPGLSRTAPGVVRARS